MHIAHLMLEVGRLSTYLTEDLLQDNVDHVGRRRILHMHEIRNRRKTINAQLPILLEKDLSCMRDTQTEEGMDRQRNGWTDKRKSRFEDSSYLI